MLPSGCGVSVVVSTFDRAPLLGPALEALLAQDDGCGAFELIVVVLY